MPHFISGARLPQYYGSMTDPAMLSLAATLWG